MKDVVIVSACRTAIGAFGGSLRDSNAAVIGSVVMKEAIQRAGIDPALIDDVRFGSCLEHEDILNVARIAALLAGIPDTVPAVTVNRVCISGMEAVISGMAMIQADMADVILAGGVDHMSGVSYTVPNARWGCRLQDQTFADAIMRKLHCGSRIIPHPETGPIDPEKPPLKYFVGKPFIMGHTAEFLAQHFDISREEMDEVALRSHHNAEQATIAGRFKSEIVPVELPQKKKAPISFDKDEQYRPGITLSQLSELPPVFIPKTGKVTAGNASGINDGAAALLIMSADKAKELNIAPLAVIKATGRTANHPVAMGLSPVPAVQNLTEKSGLTIKDFDLVELNEAFAVQYLACERELGLNRDITNINGSGIGLGHPVGATGARIMVTLINALKQNNKSLGLATLCGGGGIAMACALEIKN
jgi:acetyl-CoA C-acetyltransferase